MEKKRPTIITVVCVLGFLGAVISIPVIFSDIGRAIGAWYPPFAALSTVVGLTSMVGLWRMKKWAVILYTAMFIISQVVMLVAGIWNINTLLVLAVVAIMFSQFSKMD